MSDSREQRPVEAPLRGEAAWRAARDAVAKRNDEATKLARARRMAGYEEQAARERADERRERAELVKRSP